VMPPSEEKIQKLRTLYIEREMYWKKLDSILTTIRKLLHEEPDYLAWYEEGGELVKLPNWIHQVTGGRPYQEMPVKPLVQRKVAKREKPDLADQMFNQLMKGFK
jgi:hypothetical protein